MARSRRRRLQRGAAPEDIKKLQDTAKTLSDLAAKSAVTAQASANDAKAVMNNVFSVILPQITADISTINEINSKAGSESLRSYVENSVSAKKEFDRRAEEVTLHNEKATKAAADTKVYADQTKKSAENVSEKYESIQTATLDDANRLTKEIEDATKATKLVSDATTKLKNDTINELDLTLAAQTAAKKAADLIRGAKQAVVAKDKAVTADAERNKRVGEMQAAKKIAIERLRKQLLNSASEPLDPSVGCEEEKILKSETTTKSEKSEPPAQVKRPKQPKPPAQEEDLGLRGGKNHKTKKRRKVSRKRLSR